LRDNVTTNASPIRVSIGAAKAPIFLKESFMAAPTINTYLSDILALEKHNLQPLQSQASDGELPKFPAAKACVDAAVPMVQSHINAIEARLEALGGHAGVGVKTGVAAAAGAIAATVDHVRKTEFSKDLRDDYSSLSLTSASYTMLHATALGMNDSETAALALRHLKDVASMVVQFADALPSVVLDELRTEGATVDPSVAATAKKNLDEAWKSAERKSGSTI